MSPAIRYLGSFLLMDVSLLYHIQLNINKCGHIVNFFRRRIRWYRILGRKKNHGKNDLVIYLYLSFSDVFASGSTTMRPMNISAETTTHTPSRHEFAEEMYRYRNFVITGSHYYSMLFSIGSRWTCLFFFCSIGKCIKLERKKCSYEFIQHRQRVSEFENDANVFFVKCSWIVFFSLFSIIVKKRSWKIRVSFEARWPSRRKKKITPINVASLFDNKICESGNSIFSQFYQRHRLELEWERSRMRRLIGENHFVDTILWTEKTDRPI